MSFTPSKLSYKNYECSQCGHVRQIQTNHYGECYGQAALRMNMCPECSWKHPLDNITWKCLAAPPSPDNVPTPWTTVQLGQVATVTSRQRAHNPNCDNDKCVSDTGEVRVIPTSSEPGHGNIIACHACYVHEMAWRTERNKELAESARFPIPKWEDLEVYE